MSKINYSGSDKFKKRVAEILNNGGAGGASKITELSDVTITGVLDGQILTYNSTTEKWENKTISVKANLSDLSDVKITSPTSNQMLVYENDKWVNKTVDFSYTAGDGIDIDAETKTISTETRIVDITQSEYNALTQEEKEDTSIFYSITDSVPSGATTQNLFTSIDSDYLKVEDDMLTISDDFANKISKLKYKILDKKTQGDGHIYLELNSNHLVVSATLYDTYSTRELYWIHWYQNSGGYWYGSVCRQDSFSLLANIQIKAIVWYYDITDIT